MRSSVSVVSRCSGAKSTKVPGGAAAPSSISVAGTSAFIPSRSTASGTARSSVAPSGGVPVRVTGWPSSPDKISSTPGSVLITVFPSGRVIRAVASSRASADRVSMSRHSRGYFALATLPVRRLTTARRRSLARPLRLTSAASRSSPSMDLTGYRRKTVTVPSILRDYAAAYRARPGPAPPLAGVLSAGCPRGVIHGRVAAVLAGLAQVLDERAGEHGRQGGNATAVHPDLAVLRVPGQADPALPIPGTRPGGPLVVLDLAAAGPVKLPVIHLVVLGQQELDRRPAQAEADLDITRDLRRPEIKDEDAGTDADVKLARAGPAAQALDDAVVEVHALGFPLGSGLGGHDAVHVSGLLFG